MWERRGDRGPIEEKMVHSKSESRLFEMDSLESEKALTEISDGTRWRRRRTVGAGMNDLEEIEYSKG